MPKVSVILPTYNRAHLIKKTIDSIRDQTFRDFELIIVSNGSTDNTLEIVSSYRDERISFYQQAGSGSPASPRNSGIKHAKGEYIAFCDDDDTWLPDKLEKQVDFLSKNKDFGVCGTRMRRFNEAGNWINHDEEIEGDPTTETLLMKSTLPLSSLLIRREFLKIGFDEDKRIFGSEDYDLVLRLSGQTKLHCIPKYLLNYYTGEERYTNGQAKTLLRREVKYLKRIFFVYVKNAGNPYTNLFDLAHFFLKHVKESVKRLVYSILYNK